MKGQGDSYNKELRDAVSGVYALATQKKFRRAVSGQQPARVTGGSDPNAQLSRTWRSGGGTNRTPKGDLEVYNPRNPKERRGVSMKKGGGSQLLPLNLVKCRQVISLLLRLSLKDITAINLKIKEERLSKISEEEQEKHRECYRE